jgi:hypothetical protein
VIHVLVNGSGQDKVDQRVVNGRSGDAAAACDVATRERAVVTQEPDDKSFDVAGRRRGHSRCSKVPED